VADARRAIRDASCDGADLAALREIADGVVDRFS
jgi:hypothetical protein